MTVESFAIYFGFFLSAFLAVGGALGVVLLPNLVHCAFSLALSLLGVAGIFMLIDAPFLAVIQVLVYVGGIVVLILFAIMLTGRMMGKGERQFNKQSLSALIFVLLFFAILIITLWIDWGAVKPLDDTTATIAREVFQNYSFPLMILAVVLFLSAVGALVLARDKS
ncbi:NADH-quinone oxidoreductase subunit J [bacterium]|nr:NADH-quinone oxidoreductase subunit J [bacterium]